MKFPLYQHRYKILIGLFIVWMTFFDNNSFLYRYRLHREVKELEEGIETHKSKIAELRRQKTELFGNLKNLEKFARERYLMKKDNEDIIVIVDAEEK